MCAPRVTVPVPLAGVAHPTPPAPMELASMRSSAALMPSRVPSPCPASVTRTGGRVTTTQVPNIARRTRPRRVVHVRRGASLTLRAAEDGSDKAGGES
jgi:hypothetical protein